jgi:hypothetical protein
MLDVRGARMVQISILGYTAYSIILTQKYLMAETPTGIVSCIVTNDINLDNAILKEMQVRPNTNNGS